MNEKNAKKLRQLVRHLQGKGIVENPNWVSYQTYPTLGTRPMINHKGELTQVPHMIGQAVLDPHCGRAVYQSMKNRADRNGRGV
jgi:hypothetical protein